MDSIMDSTLQCSSLAHHTNVFECALKVAFADLNGDHAANDMHFGRCSKIHLSHIASEVGNIQSAPVHTVRTDITL